LLALIANPKAHGEVFNIGHTQEISIHDLAGLVKAMRNSPSEIVLVPYEDAHEAGFEDMPRRVPDISKIQRRIGYSRCWTCPRCWSGASHLSGSGGTAEAGSRRILDCESDGYSCAQVAANQSSCRKIGAL
jgi:hypothetical protein